LMSSQFISAAVVMAALRGGVAQNYSSEPRPGLLNAAATRLVPGRHD